MYCKILRCFLLKLVTTNVPGLCEELAMKYLTNALT